MKKILFLIPTILFSLEFVNQDALAVDSISYEPPNKSFIYINPGFTTIIPLMIESKTTTYYGVPGLPGKHSKTQRATAKDKLSLLFLDLSLGMRNLSSRHVFDRSIGIVAHSEVQMLYVQGSYLFFPTRSRGLYFGAGITCGLFHETIFTDFLPWLNLPLTLGYQFPLKTSYHFIQLQVTPLKSGTVSYGFGF